MYAPSSTILCRESSGSSSLSRAGPTEEVGDRLDGDVLREDPVRVYAASAQVAAAAFEAPGDVGRAVRGVLRAGTQDPCMQGIV